MEHRFAVAETGGLRTGPRGKVTGADISSYLAWLRTEYIPHRFSGKTHPLSPKTFHNTWIAMSALFRRAERELALPFPWGRSGTPTRPDPLCPNSPEKRSNACSRPASVRARRYLQFGAPS